MIRKVLSLFVLFFSIVSFSFAQNDGRYIIKGTIVDAISKEPIPFVNLGVLGTVAGTATNVDGEYELNVPDAVATYKVRISAIGYGVRDIKVYELAKIPEGRIELKPTSYSIGTVDVVGELKTYTKLLQDVDANISKNYINHPFNYTGYFRDKTIRNRKLVGSSEAIVRVYDEKGYMRQPTDDTYKSMNYEVLEVKREPISDKKQGFINFDEILLSDVVRNTRNILDTDNSNDYRLQNKGRMLYQGDSIQVIKYSALRPTLSNSGFWGVERYEGEVYVNLSNKAVLKNVVNIETSSSAKLGRQLTISDKVKGNVNITVSTSYKQLKGTYFMSGASISYSYVTVSGEQVLRTLDFVTTKLNRVNPNKIKGRIYFDDSKVDNEFWDNYTVYFDK